MSNLKSGFLEHAVSLLCKLILWITTTVIFFILVANTLLRYTQGSSLQWANELPELLFPWLVMSGIVLASLHGSHIATTFLMESVRPVAQRVTGILVWLAVACMYGTLSWATYRMLEIVGDERSPILQVPSSVTYGCMLGGMLMLAALALQSAWQVAQGEITFPLAPDTDLPSSAQG